MARRLHWLLTLVCGLALALPAGAEASAYSEVAQAYSASSTGTVPPCEFSSATLSAALKQNPTYNYQYGADFTNAVQAALAARANGQCRGGSGQATGAGAATSAREGVGASARLADADTRLPGSSTAASAAGLPLVLVVLFALIGACLVLGAGWMALGLLGFDPGFSRAARHSLREAEYRMGAGLEDLADRMRRH